MLMNIWMFVKKSMKYLYLKKKTFMEDITHADYVHAKRVEIKDFVEYHDCMFKEILLADVLENFRNMCLEIYELYLQKKFELLD